MAYHLVKELSPECLVLQNEAGEEFIFDKVPFEVPPRDSLRKEMQRELKEIVEEEKPIKASRLIKYIGLERYEDGLYLVRKNSRQIRLRTVESGNIEEICRALLQVLKIIQIYHRDGMAIGGLSVGIIKEGDKNSYYLQDPLIFNYLWKSLGPEYWTERPPEVIEGHQWSKETDIFSWAVVAYYLLTGVEPYPAAKGEDKAAKILRGKVISLDDHRPEISSALNNLVIGCLNKNPLKRPKVEIIISELTKLLEDKMVTISEGEAKKLQERADRNRRNFKIKESIWLWSHKYRTVIGIILGIIAVFYWMFWGSKPQPRITHETPADQVVNYYFEGVKSVDVLLVDEAIHKAKNNLSQMVSNIHVINTTNKAANPYGGVETQIKIDVEDLRLEKLSEKSEAIKYRADYRIKIIAPRVIEYLERNDEFILEPVKGVWRITDIKVLHQKDWKEEIEPDISPFRDGEDRSQKTGTRSDG